MATTGSPISSGEDAAVDRTPLLSSDDRSGGRWFGLRLSLQGAAQFLGLTGSRRTMRESAAEQLEERQSDWAYSRPVVVLDVLWNVAFVGAATGMLILSRNEAPSVPLRPWIVGYALQCVLHMICVCIEYRRRHPTDEIAGDIEEGVRGIERSFEASSQRISEDVYGEQDEDGNSIPKHLESANTMLSFVWWIIGFYWVSAGGQSLTSDAPQLYWLCIVFLAFDVFFVAFCIALACVVGIAVCCCLPCVIAILYAVADQQEGASEEDIRQLSKFRFCRIGDSKKNSDMSEESGSFGGIMTVCGSDPPIEHALSAEDAECCICLSSYVDGAELRQLPCRHHFHCVCIDKWLYINATCPLCKFNIIKSNNYGREEM